MSTLVHLPPPLYFSYKQFMVYDGRVTLPGCEWTEAHTAQGFARRESVACFSTILDFGHADICVGTATYRPRKHYERVIAVPFLVVDGRVLVDGPEETSVQRAFTLANGAYRLVAAQSVVSEDTEAIDLYFERMEHLPERSVMLVADQELDPLEPLVEIAAIAGDGGDGP